MPNDNVHLYGCIDCTIAVANNDYPDDDTRAAEVKAGMTRHNNAGLWLAVGDEDFGFSRTSCDICGSHLHGDRYLIVGLPVTLRGEDQDSPSSP